MKKANASFKIILSSILMTFLASFLLLDLLKLREVDATLKDLPAPTELMKSSRIFEMPLLKGINLDPENPLKIDFILDHGDQDDIDPELNSKLVNYFLAALTVPQDDFWVNLSPYEKDRVIEQSLGITDLGKDMLAQDYVLKQMMSSLTYPEKGVGKEYWSRLNEELLKDLEAFKTDVDTFNKVWILPGHVEVLEHGTSAIISNAELEVMLEEDYLAKTQAKSLSNQIDSKSSELLRDIIIPEIKDEVNYGKHFAPLRQLYHSLILALWFKQKFSQSFYKNYIDQHKVAGIDIEDKEAKNKIFARYKEAFEKGVYDYIKKEKIAQSKETVSRRYFSGGENFSSAVLNIDESTRKVESKKEYEQALIEDIDFGKSSVFSVNLLNLTTTVRNSIAKVVTVGFLMLSFASMISAQEIPGLMSLSTDLGAKIERKTNVKLSVENDYGDDTSSFMDDLYDTYVSEGNLSEAVDDIKVDLDRFPNSGYMFNLLAQAYSEKSKQDLKNKERHNYWALADLANVFVQLAQYKPNNENGFPEKYQETAKVHRLADYIARAKNLSQRDDFDSRTLVELFEELSADFVEQAYFGRNSESSNPAKESAVATSDTSDESAAVSPGLAFLNDTLAQLEAQIKEDRNLEAEQFIQQSIEELRAEAFRENPDKIIVDQYRARLSEFLDNSKRIGENYSKISEHIYSHEAEEWFEFVGQIYQIEDMIDMWIDFSDDTAMDETDNSDTESSSVELMYDTLESMFNRGMFAAKPKQVLESNEYELFESTKKGALQERTENTGFNVVESNSLKDGRVKLEVDMGQAVVLKGSEEQLKQYVLFSGRYDRCPGFVMKGQLDGETVMAMAHFRPGQLNLVAEMLNKLLDRGVINIDLSVFAHQDTANSYDLQADLDKMPEQQFNTKLLNVISPSNSEYMTHIAYKDSQVLIISTETDLQTGKQLLSRYREAELGESLSLIDKIEGDLSSLDKYKEDKFGGIDMANIKIDVKGEGLDIAFMNAPFDMASFSGFVFKIIEHKKLNSQEELLTFLP